MGSICFIIDINIILIKTVFVSFILENSYIKDMLVASMPSSDTNQIEQELKRSFIFGKYKASVPKKQTKQKKTLNRKQKKALGFYSIPKKSIKYEDMEVIHDLWKQYMTKYLNITPDFRVPSIGEKSWENFSLLLVKADFHGALMTIVRSRCPGLVGKKGICIMDTKNTFKIVSTDNITRSMARLHISFFSFDLLVLYLQLYPKKTLSSNST